MKILSLILDWFLLYERTGWKRFWFALFLAAIVSFLCFAFLLGMAWFDHIAGIHVHPMFFIGFGSSLLGLWIALVFNTRITRRTFFNENHPPFIGRLLLCLFLPAGKQVDRLADFDEMLSTVWIPQFGSRIGRFIYICQALRSTGAIIRIGVTAAIVDKFVRLLWR